jgi:simple sugar transport system ATP-binding protein
MNDAAGGAPGLEGKPVGAPAIRLEGITRRFGTAVANAGVDLALAPASIHALVGENGAGKSTLMRVLYGLLRPDAGRILIDERAVSIRSPAEALRRGIGMIHQHFMLVPRMTVLENIALGLAKYRGLRALPRAKLAARMANLFSEYGFELNPTTRVEALGVGERQRVEIARLLFHGARVLICDEPTAVLAPPEVETLFRILRRFRDEGRTVVFISHKLPEVIEIADRVTVLRRGSVVGEAERGAFDRARLVRWIVGDEPVRDAQAPVAAQSACGTDVALAARGVGVRGAPGREALSGVDLELRRGEIFGVAGVQGNGQRELAEVIAGRRTFDTGEILVGGARVPAGACMPEALRPAMIPEDRTTEGLIPGMTLWENLLLGHRREPERTRRGWYAHRDARAWARPLLQRFRVQPPDTDLAPEALSGGNQQKLLCARELSRAAGLLVASQPTRGIDLASTAFLHDQLRDWRAQGGSVLLLSADLDEILALSDRIGVLYRGRLSAPVPRAEAAVETLGRAMVGWGLR